MKSIQTRSAGLVLILSAVGFAQAAQADQVLTAQTVFFTGAESQTIPLDAPGAGQVAVSITDLAWPTKLQSLSFAASDASSVLDSVSSVPTSTTYQTSFSIGTAGAFFAHIAGQAGSLGLAGLPNFGLYSVEITFTPQVSAVPLPPSGWLLGAGFLGLMGFGLMRRAKGSGEAPGFVPAAA